MRRDMDLIRGLLLFIEADAKFDGTKLFAYEEPEQFGFSEKSIEEVKYHLKLLISEGFVNGTDAEKALPFISGLTWNGHEFLDNIRDKTIWERTKKRLDDLGLVSVSMNILGEIAKAELKKYIGLP